MKQVGFLITEPARDPKYPRVILDQQDIADGDRAAGYTSEPVYTLTDEDRAILTLCRDEGCPHHGTPHVCVVRS